MWIYLKVSPSLAARTGTHFLNVYLLLFYSKCPFSLKLPGERPGEKVLDYWEPGRIMLADPQAFLMSLMNFDKDSITEEMIEKLKKYIVDPSFTPLKIAKVKLTNININL